jgi:ribosomal protein L10
MKNKKMGARRVAEKGNIPTKMELVYLLLHRCLHIHSHIDSTPCS